MCSFFALELCDVASQKQTMEWALDLLFSFIAFFAGSGRVHKKPQMQSRYCHLADKRVGIHVASVDFP